MDVDRFAGEVRERYRELLHEGETAAYGLMNDSIERLNQWWREIEALAAADGLRVTVDAEVIGAGSFVLPFAFLVRPDGSNYPWRAKDGRSIPGIQRDPRLIEVDWGDTLVAARAGTESVGHCAEQEFGDG